MPGTSTMIAEREASATTPTRSFRRTVCRLVYVCAATVVALGLVEVSVRLLSLAPPLDKQYEGFVRDEFLPFKPRPLSTLAGRSASDEFDFEYTHNSLGFRDVEHAIDKPQSVFRIAGLGSSFTYGAGAPYEQTALRILEKSLNARPGGHAHVEVLKMGIANFPAEAQRLVLEHYALPFDPDLILVDFMPANVIDTYRGLRANQVSKLGYLTSREAAQLGDLATWLYVHSHAARVVLRRYVQTRLAEGGAGHWPEVYKPNGFHEKDWQEVEAQYERMIEIARAHEARIAFVYTPQKGPWDPQHHYPAQRLSAWCERQGVAFINTFPAMEQASASTPLYWDKDGHCRPAGYKVIADAVAAGLTSARLVP